MHWKEIVDLGWRSSQLRESLSKYLREKAGLYTSLTLEQYASSVNKRQADFETTPINSYCSYQQDIEVQRLLAFFVLDVQRENGGYEKVVQRDYRYEEGGLWASGLAIKEKK